MTTKEKKADEPKWVGSNGIVTTAGWTLAEDGEEYRYFWCDDWRVVTDKQVPIEGFRSTEKWQLWAMHGNDVVAVFPGCQIKSWLRCSKPKQVKRIFCF